MSIVDIAPRWEGIHKFGNYNILSLIPLSLNSNGLKLARGFMIPKSGTIDKIGVLAVDRYGTGGTYNVGIMSPDANGRPSTTTCYGGSALKSWTPAARGFTWITLDTPATATIGDYAFWYLTSTAATALNYITVSNQVIMYPSNPTGGFTAWYTSTSFNVPTYAITIFAVQYTDGTIFGFPFTSILSYSSSYHQIIEITDPPSDIYEVGARIIPEYTMRATGFSLMCWWPTDGSIRLYNSANELMSQISFTPPGYSYDYWGSNMPQNAIIHFPEPVTLIGGETYRLVMHTEVDNAYLFGPYFEDTSLRDTYLHDFSSVCGTFRYLEEEFYDIEEEHPACSLWIDGMEL